MTALVPLTRDTIRTAAGEALWAHQEDGGRPFAQALVDAIFDEADVIGDLFSPERGYLTSDDEIERATQAAVASALRSVRSSIEGEFARILTEVRAPEFVPPPAGSWVAERWSRTADVRTWHQATGDLEPALHRSGWPRIRARCGYRLGAWWHDDGSPGVDLLVVADRPLEGACGRCVRLDARRVQREAVPA